MQKNKWYDWADKESCAVLASLPETVRSKLANLVITLEARPASEEEDGSLLGLFIGSSFGDELATGDFQPPQIRMFVENIREAVDDNTRRFRQEIRTTLLHEIGHYLGWDEAQLEALGLG